MEQFRGKHFKDSHVCNSSAENGDISFKKISEYLVKQLISHL